MYVQLNIIPIIIIKKIEKKLLTQLKTWVALIGPNKMLRNKCGFTN